MNILVLGPKGVGKTTFINKMFSKYGDSIKRYIVESDSPLTLEEKEVAETYMILPYFETVRDRCNITEYQYEQWIQYYNTFYKTYNITWVSDF